MLAPRGSPPFPFTYTHRAVAGQGDCTEQRGSPLFHPCSSAPSPPNPDQDLNRTCRAMQQRVLELIPRIGNEQLTEELLIVNDNLNNVFLRHER